MEWVLPWWCPDCADGWSPTPRDRFDVVFQSPFGYRGRRRPPSRFLCIARQHDVSHIVRSLEPPPGAPPGAKVVEIRVHRGLR